MSYNRANTNLKRPVSKSRWLIVGLLAIAAVVAILELTNTTYLFHDRPPEITASPETKGEPAPSPGTDVPQADKQPTPANQDNKNVGGSAVELRQPSGSFVSNHRPNLSGSPAPNRIASVCTTTPGAACTISFAKDGVTKSLPEQVADRGGSTYWDWKLQDIGLTEGEWKVTATAKLGNQTKTATDAINLEVSQ